MYFFDEQRRHHCLNALEDVDEVLYFKVLRVTEVVDKVLKLLLLIGGKELHEVILWIRKGLIEEVEGNFELEVETEGILLVDH